MECWAGGIGRVVSTFITWSARLEATEFRLLESGSNSLLMGLKLLALPAGGEVTFCPSRLDCLRSRRAAGRDCKPVFCNVELHITPAPPPSPPYPPPDQRHHGSALCRGKPVCIDEVLTLELPVVEDAATPWTLP